MTMKLITIIAILFSSQIFAQQYTVDKTKAYIQNSEYKDMCRFVYTPYLKMGGNKILLDGYAYCLFERVRGKALNAKKICGVYSINLMNGNLDYFNPGSEMSEFYRSGKCTDKIYEELFGDGNEYGIVSQIIGFTQVAGSGYEVLVDKIGYTKKLESRIKDYFINLKKERLQQQKEQEKKEERKQQKVKKRIKKQKQNDEELEKLYR